MIELSPAVSKADKDLLRRLYPLYLHELTAFTEFYDVDDEGCFVPDYLGDWLDTRSPAVHPLLIRVDARPAGLALVAEAPFPHMSLGRDFRMVEFFVLNRYRRRGVGRAAACQAFDRFRGTWEVAQLVGNEAAIAFWRRVIGEYTGGAFEQVEIDGGPGQVFRSG